VKRKRPAAAMLESTGEVNQEMTMTLTPSKSGNVDFSFDQITGKVWKGVERG
jgi:hypothetical protein